MQFKSIVVGAMRSRVVDAYGSGQFNAPRDHHTRSHQGLDVVAAPGELALSPIDGGIVREAIPYFPFSGLLIQGTGQYSGYTVMLFYVEGTSRCGDVKAGEPVGKVQDLSGIYPGITNHIHLQVQHNGRIVPPFNVYQMSF